MANHKDAKFLLGNEVIEVEAGQIVTSEVKLSDKWGWSRCKVRAFFEVLQSDSMLLKKSYSKKTVLTLCNYSVYNDLENSKETAKKHQKDTIKNVENVNKNKAPKYTSEPKGYLPLNDGSEHPVYEEEILKWEDRYPSVDVREELRKMLYWCEDNPDKRKTKRGINAFINGWLAREQDKGKR